MADRVDVVDLAAAIARAIRQYRVNRDADGPRYAEAWMAWDQDYAGQVAGLAYGRPAFPEVSTARIL